MLFPVFHLDVLNNRILIATVAILHVVINHGMAVGGIPLVVLLERKGIRDNDPFWTDLARRLMTVFFIVTTTLGALSGVAIWTSTTLVNPAAIGSLLRIFYWTWAVEWGVFITEVALILGYYLSWKRMAAERPRAHLRLGAVLAVASWLTMALIVSILSFMMDTGSWSTKRTLLSGMGNPLYFPQLCFRTPLAMVMAGALALPLATWFTRANRERRPEAVRWISRWMLAWSLPCLAGALWYASRVPEEMARSLPVALLTQGLAGWASAAYRVAGVSLGGITLVVGWSAFARRPAPSWLTVVPAVAAVWFLGHFERVREFIRKPYAIPNYLYANGLAVEDYPLFRRDGILAHTPFLTSAQPGLPPALDRGRQVFLIACSRCHTTDGVNGIRSALGEMYGHATPWSADAIASYVRGMHEVRPFMPPFPGSDDELHALARFLASLQQAPVPLSGAQTLGVLRLPDPGFRPASP